tara:strand:- start:3182 stop:4231 length:1050 start_codon:yes stop_codon:yes gene_type:complete
VPRETTRWLEVVQTVRFLVPGTTGRFLCGGLNVELQTARLVNELCPAQVVTYRQRQDDHLFLDDLLKQEDAHGDVLWVVSWGYDVPKLLRRLRGRLVAYHAHSSGYGFDLPPGVPVLAVSRNTLGYWGDRAPRNPLFLIPNVIESFWLDDGARSSQQKRPVDVFIQQRKNSNYVLKKLVPALEKQGLKVVIQSGWLDCLIDQFNSATVVIYDSSEYWRAVGVTEGFGLPPIEALACGCIVFSSLNHALADIIDPGLFGHQVGCGSLSFDVHRIVAAVANPQAWRPDPKRLTSVLEIHSELAFKQSWKRTLSALDSYFSHQLHDDLPVKAPSLIYLKLRRILKRLKAIGL